MGDCLATIDVSQKVGGAAVPLLGNRSPSNAMWPGLRPTSVPTGILIHSPFGHKRQGQKVGAAVCLFGGAGSPCNSMSPGPRPTSVKWHLDPSSRLASINLGRKTRGCCAPFRGRWLGLHPTQSGLAEANLHTNWYVDPSSCLATIDMGRKLELLCPFEGSRVPI